MSSSYNRIWLLKERNDDFRTVRRSDPREFFAGVRREWAYRCEESERLRNDLIALSCSVPVRDSFAMFPQTHQGRSWSEYKRVVIKAVEQIRFENNRMLLRKGRYDMYELARTQVRALGRELSELEKTYLIQNPNYLSDEEMSNEEDDSE